MTQNQNTVKMPSHHHPFVYSLYDMTDESDILYVEHLGPNHTGVLLPRPSRTARATGGPAPTGTADRPIDLSVSPVTTRATATAVATAATAGGSQPPGPPALRRVARLPSLVFTEQGPGGFTSFADYYARIGPPAPKKLKREHGRVNPIRYTPRGFDAALRKCESDEETIDSDNS